MLLAAWIRVAGEGARATLETEGICLKHSPKFAGLLTVLSILSTLSVAQETHLSREGDAWTQVVSGSLAGVKNLRVKLDMGSVVVRGAQHTGIDYTLQMCIRDSAYSEART